MRTKCYPYFDMSFYALKKTSLTSGKNVALVKMKLGRGYIAFFKFFFLGGASNLPDYRRYSREKSSVYTL